MAENIRTLQAVAQSTLLPRTEANTIVIVKCMHRRYQQMNNGEPVIFITATDVLANGQESLTHMNIACFGQRADYLEPFVVVGRKFAISNFQMRRAFRVPAAHFFTQEIIIQNDTVFFPIMD
jgi:hypothetical protein